MAGGTGGGVELSAKTVDDAVAQALQRLGLRREDVEVEVLHPGSPGRLLGFGAEPARVRVRPLAAVAAGGATPPPETGDTGAGVVEAPPAGPEAFEKAEAFEEDEVEAEAEAEADAGALAGEAELASLMLAEILKRMGLDGVRVEVRGVDPILLDIHGADVADLIGRRGEHLRALQFLLNLMVNKQLRRHRRVVVDVDGYRARREELLRGMAQRFAHRVRTMREPMQLEAMPPNERRIVHLALADDPDVYTESTGEGDARRVVIKPRR